MARTWLLCFVLALALVHGCARPAPTQGANVAEEKRAGNAADLGDKKNIVFGGIGSYSGVGGASVFGFPVLGGVGGVGAGVGVVNPVIGGVGALGGVGGVGGGGGIGGVGPGVGGGVLP